MGGQWEQGIWRSDIKERGVPHGIGERQATGHQETGRQAREREARFQRTGTGQPYRISEEERTRRSQLKKAWDEENKVREQQEEANRQQREKPDEEEAPLGTQPQARDDQVIPNQTKQGRPSGITEAELTRRYELIEAWDEENHIKEQRENARWNLPADSNEERGFQAIKDQTSNLSVSGPLQEVISSFDIEATSQWTHAQPEFAWIKELFELGYDEDEIAELITDEGHQSQWTYFEPTQSSYAEMTPGHHREGCVHDVMCNMWTNFAPTSTLHRPAHKTQEWMRRRIGELCGLAGLLPSSRDHKEWNGQAAFHGTDNGVVDITFAVQSALVIDPIKQRLCEILKRLKTAFRVLQDESIACDSFTVIRSSKRRPRQMSAELVRVKASSIMDLSRAWEDFIHHDNHSGRLRLGKLPRSIIKDVVEPTTPSWLRWLEKLGEDDGYLADQALHLASLSAQVLCLGVLSYIHGHVGALHPFFLTKPVCRVNLKGIEALTSAGFQIVMETTRLPCMEGLTGNAVMVFRATYGGFDRPAAKSVSDAPLVVIDTPRYDLLASSEDLIDTWGPSLLVPSPQDKQLLAVVIGKGVITRHADDPMGLHWAPTLRDPPINTFDPYSKAFIGAACLNPDCPLDDIETGESDFNSSQMESLGTSISCWQLERGSLALGNAQYLNLTATAEFEKKPGVTLKQDLIKRVTTRSVMSLPDLEAYYGVQISLCTGLARRVRLRELLADVLPAYAEAESPTPKAWKLLGEAIVHALNGSHFGQYLDAQQDEFQISIVDLLGRLICNLEQTGFHPKQQKLIVAWIRPGQNNKCFRLPCKADTAWAGILQDTEHCATFACVTTQCLQDKNCICQQREQALWRSESKMLSTEVSQYDTQSFLLRALLQHLTSHLY